MKMNATWRWLALGGLGALLSGCMSQSVTPGHAMTPVRSGPGAMQAVPGPMAHPPVPARCTPQDAMVNYHQPAACSEAGGKCSANESRVVTYHPACREPVKVIAVGHGTISNQSYTYSAGQQKLMAMRAARVDAYRVLAEQVSGFRVSGNTTLSAMATQSDVVRAQVDAFLRGARLVSLQPVGDGMIYEATVELELPAEFIDRMSAMAPGGPTVSVNGHATQGCVGLACGQPVNRF